MALRTLIADVTLLPETDPPRRGSAIRWHTGATDNSPSPGPCRPPARKTQPLPAGRAWTEPVAAPGWPGCPE